MKGSKLAALAATVALASGYVVTATYSASAATSNQPPQSSVFPGPDLPPGFDPATFNTQQPGLSEKSQLAIDYNASLGNPVKLKEVQARILAFMQQRGVTPSSQVMSGGSASPLSGDGNSGTTGVTQYGEVPGYYCGPASAMAVLANGLGKWTAYDGQTLSESALAAPKYLNTTTNGTNWGVMGSALNKWATGNVTWWYVDLWAPSTSSLIYNSILDVNLNYPLAGDLVEPAGGTHLVGHPVSSTIYHWISIKAYSSGAPSGKYLDAVDPATTVFSGAIPYYYYDAGYLNAMLTLRGLVW